MGLFSGTLTGCCVTNRHFREYMYCHAMCMHSSVMINGEVSVSNRLQPVRKDQHNYNCEGSRMWGSCEECTLSLSGHLATLRWSLRTRIVVIVASTAFVCDCRDVRLLLLGQLKLPQLPKTDGERLQKLVLEDDTRQRGKRRVTCTGVTRTLTARDFELEELDCSKRRFLSLS